MFRDFLKSKAIYFSLVVVSFIFIIGGISSCEVGLGASVDTQPPTVDIQEPSANFIVRDVFTMTGSCSDEQGLSNVTITLRNTQTSEYYPKAETPYTAKFKFYTNRTSNGSFSRSSYTEYDEYRRNLEQVYNSSTEFYDIDRVARPKMFAQGTSGASKIYLSYFDGNHTKSPVKFRYGTANGTTVNGGIAGNTSGTSESGSSVTSTTGSAANFHVLADSTMQYQGGEYTAVGATSGGVAVVAWYDASSKQLIYSYNTTPNTPVYGGVWQTNAKVIGTSYDGWHVDLFVDSKDGIHLAFYNSGKGDLKYAYLPSYNCAASAIKVVTVDSYLSAGTNISIETRDETINGSTYIVPYISYYHASFASSPSCIRVAYMPEAIKVSGNTVTANVADGAVNDLYTGKWEVAAVPTVNIPVEDRICIGLPNTDHTTYKNTPVLGFKSDAIGYEKAYIRNK